MELPVAPDLILFVAGEPDLLPSIRDTAVGGFAQASRWVLGSSKAPFFPPKSPSPPAPLPSTGTADSPPPEDVPWHLPPPQVECQNLVVDVARRRKQTLLVVDVNRPADQRPLVEEWVRPTDVIPLLVRRDGARLDGLENFTPARLRKFVAGRGRAALLS